jgi:hypothetical protein
LKFEKNKNKNLIHLVSALVAGKFKKEYDDEQYFQLNGEVVKFLFFLGFQLSYFSTSTKLSLNFLSLFNFKDKLRYVNM